MRTSLVTTKAAPGYAPGVQRLSVYKQGTSPPPPVLRRHASPVLRQVGSPAPLRQVVSRPRRTTVATMSSEALGRELRPVPQAQEAAAAVERKPLKEAACAAPALPAAPEQPELPAVWREHLELCGDAAVLGGGAFAEVLRVHDRRSGQQYAMKVMHKPNFYLRGIERQIVMEIQAMRATAGDPHVVELIDVTEENDFVFLLLELCTDGDLLQKLHWEPSQRFLESEAVHWARQLLRGLRSIHSAGFLHRDIKLDNLLAVRGELKIGDFGWCCLAEEAQTSLAGTFQYMAPEILRNEPQSEAVDVWSAGVTIFQMLVGEPLLKLFLGPGATGLSETDQFGAMQMRQENVLQEILQTCAPAHERCPEYLSPVCWDLLRRLLTPELDLRITLADALEHPWLADASPSPAVVVCSQGIAEPTDDEVSQSGSLESADETSVSPLRGALQLSMQSPERDCKDSNVPTPSRPRSWDPLRNMAFTPPAVDDGSYQPAGLCYFAAPLDEGHLGGLTPLKLPEACSGFDDSHLGVLLAPCRPEVEEAGTSASSCVELLSRAADHKETVASVATPPRCGVRYRPGHLWPGSRPTAEETNEDADPSCSRVRRKSCTDLDSQQEHCSCDLRPVHQAPLAQAEEDTLSSAQKEASRLLQKLHGCNEELQLAYNAMLEKRLMRLEGGSEPSKHRSKSSPPREPSSKAAASLDHSVLNAAHPPLQRVSALTATASPQAVPAVQPVQPTQTVQPVQTVQPLQPVQPGQAIQPRQPGQSVPVPSPVMRPVQPRRFVHQPVVMACPPKVNPQAVRVPLRATIGTVPSARGLGLGVTRGLQQVSARRL
eukprot:TRINITY_DN112092_c0_g1_i1.p1 TRINITY_DN112092_c0_g1~~TRINITY_DN112092_c0_g1_i1.p1  ORF type:complete len:829 (+),score=173.01 TRINITY_DN112092_c0_g1_i1:82-2568(+)